MSAIREVKFLRELHHPNIIEVGASPPPAHHAPILPRCSPRRDCSLASAGRGLQLIDVFSNKSNLNLVLEFLDTDLEAVIKEKLLVFQGADIKSWMLMTMKGLEFCHRNWILHRVGRRCHRPTSCPLATAVWVSLTSDGWR